jgi:hypothetical protein
LRRWVVCISPHNTVPSPICRELIDMVKNTPPGKSP